MVRRMIHGGKLVWLVLLLSSATAAAQSNMRLSADYFRDGRKVREAFRSVVAEANEATVRLYCENRLLALGTIVGPNGWVVTKYSELRAPLDCRLEDGRVFGAKVVGHDPEYDLAMLKIDAQGLKSAVWLDATQKDSSGPGVGQFVAAAGPGELPRAIGVVSVPPRKISPRPGVLGIQLDAGDGGPKITQVLPGSSAEQAGLQAGDIITKFADSLVESREKLLRAVRRFRAGDTVTIQVRRGEDEMEITATLSPRETVGQLSRADRMNAMGGPLSVRATDFPLVLQHDAVLRPNDCGGPLVDLSGKVVGLNIARGGRTESYAIPTAELLPRLADLMSGKLAPTAPLPGSERRESDQPEMAEAASAGD